MRTKRLMIRGTIGLALAAFLGGAGLVAPASAATDVVVPDAALENCLKRARSTPVDPRPLTVTDIEAMMSVSCTAVADLTGLEHAINIERANFYEATFSSLAPIANSTKLVTFSSTSLTTTVSDLSPLSGARGLETLEINGAPVTSLTPLAGLPELRSLALRGTQISDLGPLRDIDTLLTIGIDGSLLTDLTPVAALDSLESLYITDAPLSDLAPIRGMTDLLELDISFTAVSDLTPIAGLANLVDLSFDETPVSSLEALRGMTQLYDVGGEGAAVTDVSPIPSSTEWIYLPAQRAKAGPVAPAVATANPIRGYGGEFLAPSAASLAAAGATLSADNSTITFATVGTFPLEWETEPQEDRTFDGTVTFSVAVPAPETPTGATPGASGTALAATGVNLAGWPLAATMALLGAAVLFARRRRA